MSTNASNSNGPRPSNQSGKEPVVETKSLPTSASNSTSLTNVVTASTKGSAAHKTAQQNASSSSSPSLTSPKNGSSSSSSSSSSSGTAKRSSKANDVIKDASGNNLVGDSMIVDVWAHNLKKEMEIIQGYVDQYNYIAMDTEFPGVVARPIGSFKNSHDYHYQTLKCNVDLLKIIQLGLCFCDSNGNLAPGTCTWQFNFKFNLSEDMYAQDSIDLLSKSGIDFKEHDAKGIDVNDFAEVLMTSGIVLNDNVKWMSFHSGYDYGYLLKVLTCQPLPKEESEFFELLRMFFPCVYDIKYLMKSCENLKGGLQKVAEKLQIERIGPQHQAGSDSLLTAATFFKMRHMFFENQIDEEKYANVLFGLGQNLRVANDKKKRDSPY